MGAPDAPDYIAARGRNLLKSRRNAPFTTPTLRIDSFAYPMARWPSFRSRRSILWFLDLQSEGAPLLKTGILNPAINSLLSRVRHSNTLVIADRGMPSWPGLETIDITLTDDLPRVLDVLRAVRPVFSIGAFYMAQEFLVANSDAVIHSFGELMHPVPVTREPHIIFQQRVPAATGLIRTADTIRYASIILESA